MVAEQLRQADQEINLLDIFIVFLKRKTLIIGGTLALAALTATACLIMSPIYRSTTTVMPPQAGGASSSVGQLLGQFAGVASMVLGSTTGTTGSLYVGLLQTQAVLDPIIDRFNIMKLYGLDTREDARDFVINNILTAETDLESGIISISADDKSPQRAADIANAFAQELKKIFENMATSDAGKRRVFFESQLKTTQENLTRSELAMRSFAETTGAIRIDEQATAALQGIMNLKSNIASKEVQLQVMKTFAAKDNPDLKRSEQELQALKDQLRKLEEKEDESSPNAVIPTEQIPGLGMEYLRKYRDFKYHEMLYELMVKQYEAARLEEAKETAPIQLIHSAIPPTKKAKPKLILLMLLAMGIGFFLTTCAAFAMEFMDSAAQHPENQRRFHDLRSFLRIH